MFGWTSMSGGRSEGSSGREVMNERPSCFGAGERCARLAFLMILRLWQRVGLHGRDFEEPDEQGGDRCLRGENR